MKNRSIKPNKRKFREDTKKVTPLMEMTQEELISLGYRLPYFIKPDFSKTEEERIALKKVHTNKKGPTGGNVVNKGKEAVGNLIVHLANNTTKNFKNTHCFKAKASEISSILYVLLRNETVTKAWFQGQTLPLRKAA